MILNQPTGKVVGDYSQSRRIRPAQATRGAWGGPVAADQLTFSSFWWSRKLGLRWADPDFRQPGGHPRPQAGTHRPRLHRLLRLERRPARKRTAAAIVVSRSAAAGLAGTRARPQPVGGAAAPHVAAPPDPRRGSGRSVFELSGNGGLPNGESRRFTLPPHPLQ